MKIKTKIILGSILAILLLACLAVVGLVGAFFYIDHQVSSPEMTQKTKKAESYGIEFAKTTDQNGCMEKGFSLEVPTSSFDYYNTAFVKSCLKSSKPTLNFCEGVPFMFDRKWFDEQCKIVGHNRDACIAAFIAKRDFCMDSKIK